MRPSTASAASSLGGPSPKASPRTAALKSRCTGRAPRSNARSWAQSSRGDTRSARPCRPITVSRHTASSDVSRPGAHSGVA
eukprot:4904042-Prymnesium_polylepis.1